MQANTLHDHIIDNLPCTVHWDSQDTYKHHQLKFILNKSQPIDPTEIQTRIHLAKLCAYNKLCLHSIMIKKKKKKSMTQPWQHKKPNYLVEEKNGYIKTQLFRRKTIDLFFNNHRKIPVVIRQRHLERPNHYTDQTTTLIPPTLRWGEGKIARLPMNWNVNHLRPPCDAWMGGHSAGVVTCLAMKQVQGQMAPSIMQRVYRLLTTSEETGGRSCSTSHSYPCGWNPYPATATPMSSKGLQLNVLKTRS